MTRDHLTDRILAYLRAHVTLRLLEQLSAEVVHAAVPRRVSIQLRTPGGPACHVRVAGGVVRFAPRARALPSVSLVFPRPEHLVATLTGGKAPVVPLPGGPRFLGAVKAFRALTAALQDRFKDPEARPRLLLLATIYAVEEVSNRDPYVAARVARIPDGLIDVRVAGDEAIRAWVRKRDGVITTGAGFHGAAGMPVSAAATSAPNAELEFADRDAAIDLLTGATPAMLALAERRVRLYGRLGMIENLFPVLDRVSDYLGG